jgi:hypothetical protein
MAPDEIRANPQFEKFCETAEWLAEHDRPVGHKLQGWRLYLAFVCDDLANKRFRPSPAHLMSEWMLERFNKGCGFEREHKPKMDRNKLAARYKRALHPSLRSTACIKAMGFDLLHE